MNSKQVATGTSETKMPPIDPKFIAGLEPPPVAAPVLSGASSIIDEVKQLQAALASKRNSAIETLLAQRTDIDATLTSLGFSDEPKERTKKRQSKVAAERVCKICSVGGKTVLGHDARAHRSQTKKRPFNAEELAMHA